DVTGFRQVGVFLRLWLFRRVWRRGFLVVGLDLAQRLLATGQTPGVLQGELALLDGRLLAAALGFIQGHAGVLHQFPGELQALAGEDEVRVLCRALVVARLQFGQERLERVEFRANRR